jgi:tetratricopeptide (TPR) repeat protein
MQREIQQFNHRRLFMKKAILAITFTFLCTAANATGAGKNACDTETDKAKATLDKCIKIGKGKKGYDECAKEYSDQRAKAQQSCQASPAPNAGSELGIAVKKWEAISNTNKCRTSEGKNNANCATILQQWGQELYKAEEANAKNNQSAKANHEGSLSIFLDYIKYFPDSPSAPNVLFQASFILETKGELKQALELRQTLAKKYPNHALAPSALVRIGEYYYGSKKWPEAIEAYENYEKKIAGAATPNKKEAGYAIFRLAESYYNMAKYGLATQKFKEYIDGADKGKYVNDLRSEAVKYLEGIKPAANANPTDARSYYNRGITHWEKKEYDKAIADLTEAIRLGPNDSAMLIMAYLNRGVAYSEKKEYDKAIADYTEIIRRDPNDVEAYFRRGTAYYDKGDYDRAIADYTKTISLSPNETAAYYMRGNSYYAKDDYDRVISDYNEAIRLNPNFAETYYRVGNTYYKKGNYDKAIANYDKALQLKPDHAGAKNNRSAAYGAKSGPAKAIVDFNTAVQIEPEKSEVKEEFEIFKEAR